MGNWQSCWRRRVFWSLLFASGLQNWMPFTKVRKELYPTQPSLFWCGDCLPGAVSPINCEWIPGPLPLVHPLQYNDGWNTFFLISEVSFLLGGRLCTHMQYKADLVCLVVFWHYVYVTSLPWGEDAWPSAQDRYALSQDVISGFQTG